MVRIKISLGIIIAMLVMSVSGIFVLNYKTDHVLELLMKLEVIPIRKTKKKHWRRQTVLKRNGRNITLMQVFLSDTIKLQVFRLLCPDLSL